MIELLHKLQSGDVKSLARALSYVENSVPGYREILQNLAESHTKVIGITGPPGAGKSTLTDALIGVLVNAEKRVGVLCIDPSSPFNFGALLGDRIRMNRWYNNKNVFIRSLATRGSLGGLHPSIIEITDVMKAARFDNIIVETVGVGQSEVEIAGLADTTVVVLVPEGGDEVQSMKAGLMEIADIFVVNKADRPDADTFVQHIKQMLTSTHGSKNITVLKTVAAQDKGIKDLFEKIQEHQSENLKNDKYFTLLAEKAYHLIRQERIKDLDKGKLKNEIEEESKMKDFNFYNYVNRYYK